MVRVLGDAACKRCGARRPSNRRFCTQCGHDGVTGRHTRKQATEQDRRTSNQQAALAVSAMRQMSVRKRWWLSLGSVAIALSLFGSVIQKDQAAWNGRFHEFGAWLGERAWIGLSIGFLWFVCAQLIGGRPTWFRRHRVLTGIWLTLAILFAIGSAGAGWADAQGSWEGLLWIGLLALGIGWLVDFFKHIRETGPPI